MKRLLRTTAVVLAVVMFWVFPIYGQDAQNAMAPGRNYKSFTVSTYVIQGTVQGLMNGNPDPSQSWGDLTRNLKIEKIYVEVMRNHTLADETGLDKLKQCFQDRGVEVCGGLAYSISESNGYQGVDYADPEKREFARKTLKIAACHFDEMLLDKY